MRIKNILVPVDYTDCSINALDYAGNLADVFESRILILHGLSEKLENKAQLPAYKERQLTKMIELTAGVPSLSNDLVDFKIDKELIQDAISNAIQGHDIDLVVMGARREEKVLAELVHSNTFQAVEYNQCPVIVVPEHTKWQPINKIGLASDFKSIEHTSSLDVVLDFCYAFNAEIEIFHVEPNTGKKHEKKIFELLQLQDYFSNLNYSFHELKGHHDTLEEDVNSFITDHNLDLLILMHREYGALKTVTHKSLIRSTIYHTSLPVLIFHE